MGAGEEVCRGIVRCRCSDKGRNKAWGRGMYRDKHTVRKEAEEEVILEVRFRVKIGV